MLKLVFAICALVCFLLKAFNVPLAGIDLMNLGFAFVVAATLLPV